MTALFAAVLRMSIGAGLTALLVLMARALAGRRPGVLMPLLYALVLLRLMLPFSVASPLSLENLLPRPAAQAVTLLTEIPAEAEAHADAPGTPPAGHADSHANNQHAGDTPRIAAPSLSPFDIAAIVWSAGAAALLLILSAFSLRFALILRRNRPYTAPGFDALLASCSAELCIQRRVTAVRFSGVNAAAVYGAFRPKLLICPQRFETLSESEKRGVLLHELAHIRRGDTVVCLLLALAGAMHWFNPLVLLALVLMRRDMEAFCDAAVLKKLDEAGRREYARTLMKLSEGRDLRLTTALSISKKNIKRRIIMASRYRKTTSLHVALALLLALIIAAAGCTSAAETQPTQPGVQVFASPSASQAGADASVTPSASPEESEYIITQGGTVIYNTQSDGVSICINGFVISSGNQGERMWQIPLNSYEEGTIANIKKAAQLLDGTVIAYGDSVDLIALLGSLTEADGWANAPMQYWYTMYYTISSDTGDVSVTLAFSPGGGAEIILSALANGAQNLGCDTTIQYAGGGYILGGSIVITNTQFEAGLELRAEVHGDTLIVAVRDASQPYSKPSLLTIPD